MIGGYYHPSDLSQKLEIIVILERFIVFLAVVDGSMIKSFNILKFDIIFVLVIQL